MSDGSWQVPGGDESWPDTSSDDTSAPPPPPPPGSPPPPAPWASAADRGGPAGQARRIGTIPLRPLGVGEALDATFKLFRAVLLPAILVVGVLVGPTAILTAIGAPNLGQQLQDVFRAFEGDVAAVESDPFAVFTPLYVLGALIGLLVAPLVSTSLTWLGIQSGRTSLPGVGEAIAAGARWYLRTLGALLLLGLVLFVPLAVVGGVLLAVAVAGGGVVAVLVGIPLFLAFIAAIVLYVALSALVPPVVVFEDLGPTAAVRRTWELVRRRFWPVLGYVVLAAIVFGLAGGAVGFVFQIPAFLPFPGSQVFLGISALVNQMLTSPLTAFFALAVYVDLRVRTEGYDVEVRANELQG